MKVESQNLLDIAKNVLVQVGIHEYRDINLTYASKTSNEWRVNFSYFKGLDFFQKVSSFAVDAETGEIRGLWLDRTWK